MEGGGEEVVVLWMVHVLPVGGGSEHYWEWTGPLVRVEKTLNVFYSIVFDCPLPGP